MFLNVVDPGSPVPLNSDPTLQLTWYIPGQVYRLYSSFISIFGNALLRIKCHRIKTGGFFSEKIIAGPHGVPDPPSLAQMTFTQYTSMSELKFDSVAPPGGQI